MVLKSTSGTDVSVYQVAGTNASRVIPDWLARKRKRSLKQDAEYANRIEVIQEFEFREASNRIKVTRDGQFCMATGVYKPQIHVYDFQHLSKKFERHTDAENIDFVLISDDWTKSVHLQSNRVVEFHAQGGIHTRSRIPKEGRALSYNSQNCDMYIAASSSELYRLNIDQGRFMAPFELASEGANCLDINSCHGLVSCGMEDGTVEFWDPRARRRAAQISSSGNGGIGGGITAVSYKPGDALSFAVGTHEGETLLYDLRSPAPLLRKDQGYGFPVHSIRWIDTQGAPNKILSADKKIVKIWDAANGDPYASCQPSVDINDVALVPDSGMIMLANEGQPMHMYFLPSIAPAPKWCHYLDNITEEMEESSGQGAVYQNLKFVTRRELQQLNLEDKIGTNLVVSAMHGYFIDADLYDKARSIANPYAYREDREREIKKRIEKERESRIRTSGAVSKKAALNQGLVSELARDKKSAAEIIADDRFKAVFENPEFAIDETSREYRLIKPTQSTEKAEAGDYKSQLTAVDLENESAESSSSSSEESESEPESLDEEASERRKKLVERRAAQEARRQRQLEVKQKQVPAMTAVRSKVQVGGETFGDQVKESSTKEELEERHRATVRKTAQGEVEMSFVPKSTKDKKQKAVKPAEDNVDSGRKRQRHEGRRKASKNAFRGM
ncbi:ribosome biogenesis protein Enp2p [Trichomonascus vanleenenianus]|uniref:ribosome biosynthesis protein ENP2 n=1 Tax=Trichomonascus vanleenenianus TaxID=2268995 RepID=UPI003ECA8BCC